MTENILPKNYRALIKFCKLVLDKQKDITYEDVEKVQNIIQKLLDDGLSPANIRDYYNIKYSDFGMFLKKCLKIKLKSCKESVNNYYKMNNKSLTDEKKLYKKACQFVFDPFSIKEIPGYNLLLELDFYHPINNPNGVCRDHMVSVEYGWRNKINPKIISHPMNCRFITNQENIIKGEKCCITLENLLKRIDNNNFTITENISIHLPKSEDHRKKLGIANSKLMNITNGIKNLRIPKESEIPQGFRRGMTRRNGASNRT